MAAITGFVGDVTQLSRYPEWYINLQSYAVLHPPLPLCDAQETMRFRVGPTKTCSFLCTIIKKSKYAIDQSYISVIHGYIVAI